MKVWKRCLAAVLAFMIFTTSVNFTEAAGTYDTENFIWTATDAEVVAGYYGLDEKVTAVLSNNAVKGGESHKPDLPYDNDTVGKNDLITVDYENRYVYAKALYTDGLSWLPTEAIISAEGEEESITLTTGVCYYDEIEYYAKGAFTYSGNSYNVNVIYQLHIEVSTEEQTRILEIPQILAQTANNLEVNLNEINSDLKKFSDMVPYLYELVNLEFTKKESVTNEETGESEIIEKKELAFDPVDDAEVIATIEALYKEYTENGGLILSNISETYGALTGNHIISYTFQEGARILTQSESIYNHMDVLKKSSKMTSVFKKLATDEPELFAKLDGLMRIVRELTGKTLDPGILVYLKDSSNWTILDEEVQARIFSDDYSEEDFENLEYAVYRLRNYELEMPVIETESLLAAEIGVECDITFYEITVTVNGETTSGTLEDSELYPLESVSTIVKLLEGSTADEIKEAIEDKGIERLVLSSWNALDSEYQINTSNYEREESSLPKELREDIEYNIFYSPKIYTLKTNFDGNKKVPFGYVIELPIGDNQDVSYDYVVELENGTSTSCSEGTKIKVTQSMTITQTTGTEKTEYRLYDFLVNDTRYSMSEEVKQILLSTAIESPTLKIRMPDSNKVGDIIAENGGYYIEAKNSSAGILGTSWVPQTAFVMNGEEVLLEVPFEDGIARWTTGGFTHVNVSYQLKIERVEGGLLGDRPLDETTDVLYALNLPHELVTHTVKQNQLLNGTEGVTAKVLYQELTAVEDMMTSGYLKLLSSMMDTQEQKNAMKRLLESEEKGGAWNSAANELALYTYLKACDSANWSLAVYYEQGLYLKVAEQASVVADCLEVILESETLWETLNGPGFSSYKSKMEKIVEMLPNLRELSASIEGPHEAIDMEDEGYQELINLLLSMEGKTSAIEDSDGVYAYSTIRRNQGSTGTLTVSVKVGTKLAQSRVLTYTMEEETEHKLTEEEAAKIQEMIAELEKEEGMTEEEKLYYTSPSVAIPKAGEAVKKNAEICLVYSPREYLVTIAGVPEYEARFRYKGDYIISLPPYSEEADAKCKYVYWIDENTPIEVENGTEYFYEFTKEDLTTRFVGGHFEILKRQEVVLAAEVKVEVNLDTNLIKGYQEEIVDSKNINLYLDAHPEGIKASDFMKLVNFTAEEDTEIEIGQLTPNGVGGMSADDLVINGSTIDCITYDKKGNEFSTTFTIIILGDVNKSGKLDTNDSWIIAASYTGNMKNPIGERDSATKLAADVNGNGCYMDSNDVWQILRKLNYWDTDQYTSVLAQ